ncbi:hypothetical protein BDZ97DRAFT_1770851 [Flammula alnicola]|nr:hypothetical protein BDZ97DRAFT_1770851 [Flammula alnicola]
MSQLKDDRKVVLPYELERDIFELAARAFPGNALELVTISRYADLLCAVDRTEALIYETVVLESRLATDLFLRTLDVRPPSFFAKNIKRFYLTEVVSFYDVEAQRILAGCTGLTEVTCWVYPHSFKDNLLPQLPTHNLQRLSIPLEALWGISPLSPQFTASLFPNLSHLEIVNPPGLHAALQIDWDGLIALPRLTHLALGELYYDKPSVNRGKIGMWLWLRQPGGSVASSDNARYGIISWLPIWSRRYRNVLFWSDFFAKVVPAFLGSFFIIARGLRLANQYFGLGIISLKDLASLKKAFGSPFMDETSESRSEDRARSELFLPSQMAVLGVDYWTLLNVESRT